MLPLGNVTLFPLLCLGASYLDVTSWALHKTRLLKPLMWEAKTTSSVNRVQS